MSRRQGRRHYNHAARVISRLVAGVSARRPRLAAVLAALAWAAMGSAALAQTSTGTGSTPPSPDASCTVTAMNRTAPLEPDYSFTLYNIPGAATAVGAQ